MPPKTKAEVGRMVASAAMKKYKNYSAIQLSRELNRLMKLEKKQTMPANVIRIRVVKKLASKVSDKEISATEARQSLRKKVPEKKQVSKKEFEKARKDLKDKKVSKPAPKKKTKKVKVDFDDLYAGGGKPLGEYINEWSEEEGMSFAKVRATIRRILKDYNKTESPSVEGAAKFIRNMTTKEQEKYMTSKK